jgi:hypothetical protein
VALTVGNHAVVQAEDDEAGHLPHRREVQQHRTLRCPGDARIDSMSASVGGRTAQLGVATGT